MVKKRRVSELNLDIRKGEIFGLLGPNGAGKNDDDPDAPWPYGAYFRDGFYQWPGLYERSPSESRPWWGYLPDQMGFYADMTGRENLRFTGRLNGLKGTLLEERIDSLLERVRMTEAADKKTGTYSRGYEAEAGDCGCADEGILRW